MKKRIIRVISFFLFCLSLFSAFQYPVKAQRELYVALGDSISNGFGLKNREEDCCVYLVGRHFGYETRNYGVDGLTSDGLLEKLQGDVQMRDSISRAALITVEIGSNDLLGLFSELFGSGESIVESVLKLISNPEAKAKIDKATGEVIEKLKAVFVRVRELNPRAKLVVAEIYNPWYGMGIPSFPDYCDRHLGVINEAIREEAQNYNYTVAEVHRPFKEHKLVCGDFSKMDLDPHPTVRGHSVYADMLIRAAEKKLEGHFHTYGEWESGDGECHLKVCGCGNVITERHAWKLAGVVKKATHTESGERLYECSVCNSQKTEEIAKNGYHLYGAFESAGEDSHKSVCACGDTKVEAHVWMPDKSAGTAESEAYVCARCKATKTKIISSEEPSGDAHKFILPLAIFGAVSVLAGSVGVLLHAKKKAEKKKEDTAK